MKAKERKRKEGICKMKFIGYVPFGTPTIEGSMERIDILIDAGCRALEISFPLYDPVGENEMIVDFMRRALQNCSDYQLYCDKIVAVRQKYPEIEINLLVFVEVINKIGLKKFADLFKKCGINAVISPDIDQYPDKKEQLSDEGVCFVAPFHYDVDPDELKICQKCRGFVYTQAFPPAWQKVKKGYDNPKQLIQFLRENGVTQPIYAGVGIRTLEDIKTVKEAGADGFFVGSTLMKLWDDPEAFRKKAEEIIEEGR